MDLYTYDKDGLYVGIVQAQVDPLASASAGTNVYLYPANATDTVPPEEVGKWPVFSGGSWTLLDDFRGQTIYQGTNTQEMLVLGAVPEGWSLTPTQEFIDLQARNAFLQARAEAVAAITVTVNGNTYDGHEVAQTRMKGAADAARVLGSPTVPLWVLADNTVIYDVPVADLDMAHALAFVAMGELWVPQ